MTNQRVHLTKEEKAVFRGIIQKGNERPAGITDACFFLCVISLRQKGLIEAIINYNKIVDVKASYIGVAYYCENPTLRNPVDWYKIVTTIALILTAIATSIALFIGCQALK
ncbi:MAG: hypothetical protein LBL79_08860 [Prevotella sp.]|jgi:hypothetical protein|nr:hypothetical protein [Prevotella sp.]